MALNSWAGTRTASIPTQHVWYPTKEKKKTKPKAADKTPALWAWVQDKEPPIFLEGTAKTKNRQTYL